MRAAIVEAPHKVQVEEVPAPDPGPQEVRVKLQGCGVCGSNLAPWEGRPWFRYPLAPGELGHEGWGIVEGKGRDVAGIQEGDRVAVLSYRAYAEYDTAPASHVIKIPREMDGQPVPGEALGCAMNVLKRCAIQPGQTVAVVGVGFLGAVLVALASKANARVIAISRRTFARETAKRMGASHTIPMEDHSHIVEVVKELTNGKGCDRVIEAVGQQWPLDLASDLTRERGRLIIAGYHQDGPRQVNMQSWNWRGLDVINAHERDSAVYVQGIQDAVDAIASGQLDPTPLYTHSFALDSLSDALNAMSQRPGTFMKALVSL
jgi:threonine dehydrogenase-like Zn-dependent dehydrogenase